MLYFTILSNSYKFMCNKATIKITMKKVISVVFIAYIIAISFVQGELTPISTYSQQDYNQAHDYISSLTENHQSQQRRDFSPEPSITKLALAGGGISIYATAGSIIAIEASPKVNLDSIAGSDAGALASTLYVGGYNSTEILAILYGTPSTPRPMSPDIVAANIFRAAGVFDLTILQYTTNALLALTTGIGDPIYGSYGITFSQLYNFNPVNLTIVAYNMNLRQLEYFNYINTPDMEVGKAIAATSAGYPLHLTLYQADNGYFYAQGDVGGDNYPIELFKKDHEKTLGVDILWNYEITVWDYEHKGADIVIGASNLFAWRINPHETVPGRLQRRTAYVNMPSFAFQYMHYANVTQKEAMVKAGYLATLVKLAELV